MKNFTINSIYQIVLNFFIISVLIFFLNACTSSAKYTNYKSFQYTKNDKKPLEASQTKKTVQAIEAKSLESPEIVEIQDEIKLPSESTKTKDKQQTYRKSSPVIKSAVKTVSKSIDRLETLAKNPSEIQNMIKGRQDIASIENTSRDSLVGIFWTIFAIAIVIWLLGFLFGNVGNLIHILLVVAVVFLILALIPR